MKVYQEQKKLARHKQYFAMLANNHSTALIALLLPSFIAGWQSGRQVKPGNKIKQLAKYLSHIALKNVGKQMGFM